MENKKNKKVFWHLLFIVILLVTIYRANYILSDKYVKAENIIQRKDLALRLPEDSIDVFFLGSSGLFAGVSPNNIWKAEKIRSFNFSSSDQPYIVRYYNLLDLMDRQKPKLIVMDISSLNKQDLLPTEASYESYFRKGYFDISDQDLRKQYLDDLNEWFPEMDTLDYKYPLLRFHSAWSDINEDNFKEYEDPENYTNFLMGSLLSTTVKKVEFKDYTGSKFYSPSDFNSHYAKKIVELARDNDIDLVFIITPKTRFYPDKDFVSRTFAEENGVKFINFSEVEHMENMKLDLEKDFYNWGHLNIWGNEKFSSYLASFLVKEYPQVKTEGTKNTNFWKRSLKYYEDYIDSIEEELSISL